MQLYFSHPTFTFKTKTERKCISIINEHLEPDELTNPADYGLKDDLKSELKKSDGIVAMAVSGVFTYLVWKEMEMVEEEVKLYTFMVENKENIGPLVKGVPEKIKRLSKKESKRLSYEITKNDYQEGFISSLVGSYGSRF
ncbi:MAG: hypothetical protein KGY66_01775 [Candidatus Thermoplasmatota archaeon]|nr:hypothetical protein [Candidatus Thermoplasmatota archaeon]MBS3789625.1 hypothetical protein [Candidatus Thermoplasmatota archaeon]